MSATERWAVVRNPRRERFVVVDREIVRHPQLSFNAKGVLLWILDQPESAVINRHLLAMVGPDGERAARSALRELTAAGYVCRESKRGTDGRIRTVTTVYEVPPLARNDPAAPEVRNVPAVPLVRNVPAIRKTEEELGKPSTSTPPPSSASVVERLFDEIWKAYPRKVARKAALKAFVARLRAKDATPSDLAIATRNYAAAVRGKDPEYVMHGSTFFGPGERWKDYLAPHTSQQSSARRTSSMPWMD